MKRLLVFLSVMVFAMAFGISNASAEGSIFGNSAEAIKVADTYACSNTYGPGLHNFSVNGDTVAVGIFVGGKDGGENIVKRCISNNRGLNWLACEFVASSPRIDINSVRIGLGLNNSTHLIWHDYDKTRSLHVIKHNGNIISGSLPVTSPQNDNIAVSGNNIAISFQSDVYTYLVKSVDGGASFSSPEQTSAPKEKVALAIDSSGNIYLVWRDVDSIKFSKKTSGKWSAPLIVNGSQAHGDMPSISVKDSKNIAISWGNSSGVIVATTSNGGAKPSYWSQTIVASSSGAKHDQTSVVFDSSGRLNVAFNTSSGVKFSRASKTGNKWLWQNRPSIVMDLAGISWPNLAIDSKGKANVIASMKNEGKAVYFIKEK